MVSFRKLTFIATLFSAATAGVIPTPRGATGDIHARGPKHMDKKMQLLHSKQGRMVFLMGLSTPELSDIFSSEDTRKQPNSNLALLVYDKFSSWIAGKGAEENPKGKAYSALQAWSHGISGAIWGANQEKEESLLGNYGFGIQPNKELFSEDEIKNLRDMIVEFAGGADKIKVEEAKDDFIDVERLNKERQFEPEPEDMEEIWDDKRDLGRRADKKCPKVKDDGKKKVSDLANEGVLELGGFDQYHSAGTCKGQ